MTAHELLEVNKESLIAVVNELIDGCSWS
jgi:hypothetical protein